jgi:hypothetical protein
MADRPDDLLLKALVRVLPYAFGYATSVNGTKLPIRDVRCTVANGGRPDMVPIENDPWMSWIHIVVGFSVPVLFALHIFLGRR